MSLTNLFVGYRIYKSIKYVIHPLASYIHTEWNSSGMTPFCYIFSVQVPGSVPLYRVIESKYTNRTVDYEYIYVIKDDIPYRQNITDWIYDDFINKVMAKDWTETYNTGIIGYVYPFTQEIL